MKRKRPAFIEDLSEYKLIKKLAEKPVFAIAIELKDLKLIIDVLHEFRGEIPLELISTTLNNMIMQRSLEIAMLIYYHDPAIRYNLNHVDWFRQLDAFLREHNLNNFAATIAMINVGNNFVDLALEYHNLELARVLGGSLDDNASTTTREDRSYSLTSTTGQTDSENSTTIVTQEESAVNNSDWFEMLDWLLESDTQSINNITSGATEDPTYSAVGAMVVPAPSAI